MRLPSSERPLNFMHLLAPIEYDRTPEKEIEIVEVYKKLYPYGVPLRIDDPSNRRVMKGVAAWFRWGRFIYRIEETENSVMYVDQAKYARWFRLTDPDNLRKWLPQRFFGVPTLAAACLFLRNGDEQRKCPICKKSHKDGVRFVSNGRSLKADFGLKFDLGSLVEWRKDDYARIS